MMLAVTQMTQVFVCSLSESKRGQFSSGRVLIAWQRLVAARLCSEWNIIEWCVCVYQGVSLSLDQSLPNEEAIALAVCVRCCCVIWEEFPGWALRTEGLHTRGLGQRRVGR